MELVTFSHLSIFYFKLICDTCVSVVSAYSINYLSGTKWSNSIFRAFVRFDVFHITSNWNNYITAHSVLQFLSKKNTASIRSAVIELLTIGASHLHYRVISIWKMNGTAYKFCRLTIKRNKQDPVCLRQDRTARHLALKKLISHLIIHSTSICITYC